jgi:hypothetical protein
VVAVVNTVVVAVALVVLFTTQIIQLLLEIATQLQ